MKSMLCMFQMMRAADGTRSRPFTMTVSALSSHFRGMESIDEIKDDFVLVLMELGPVDPDVKDYTELAANGVFSTAPVMTVSTFIATFKD